MYFEIATDLIANIVNVATIYDFKDPDLPPKMPDPDPDPIIVN